MRIQGSFSAELLVRIKNLIKVVLLLIYVYYNIYSVFSIFKINKRRLRLRDPWLLIAYFRNPGITKHVRDCKPCFQSARFLLKKHLSEFSEL